MIRPLQPPATRRRALEADPDLLADWCRQVCASAAALYLEDEGARSLVLRQGEGEAFPKILSDDLLEDLAGEGTAALERVELAGAVVLYRPGTESRPAALEAANRLLAAQLKIRELEEVLRQQRFQAKYRGVELEALYDVGLAITSTLDLGRLSEEILLRAVSLLDARRGAFFAGEEGGYRLRSAIGGDALDEVCKEGDPLLDWLRGGAKGQAPEGCPEPLPGCRHLLAAGVETESRFRGLLVVGDKEDRFGVGPFTERDRRTLALFGQQAAIALENAHLHQQALEKERLERDMELAAQIQQQILPKALPAVEGYELFGWNRPARQVGGDFFDALKLPDGRLILVVADVSGKGMPAALMVSTLHSALRLGLDQQNAGPELLVRLNRHILDLSLPNKFITLFLAELRPESGRLRYLNAGHNPALLLHADGQVESLPAGGLPLGLMPGAQYEAAETACEPGSLLCLYSDGITETTSPDDEELGEERLTELLQSGKDLSLEELKEKIEARCSDFSQGQPQGDDQTLVFLRRLV